MAKDQHLYASGVAAYAAGIRIRPFRHFVSDIDDHDPGHYRTFSTTKTILVAAGFRLHQYGLASATALRVAVDILGPILEPVEDYSLAPWLALKTTAGLWLHVHIDPDGVPRATLGRRLLKSEGVMIDVGALAATVIERLGIVSPSPVSGVAAGLRAAKATSGARRAQSFEQGGQPAISVSNKESSQ